ncbi:pole-organizing protein PopZ [Parasphingorhabdus litoris]|uniref:Pole-organizing protein PopZ n=2 Tax=Parasphingorhabdus litoris TaxID=394733 RepID=A0ABN1AB79_9SPHN
MEEILSSIKRIIAEDKAIEPDRSIAKDDDAMQSKEAAPRVKSVPDNVTPIAPLPKNIASKGDKFTKPTVKTSADDDGVLELTNEVKDSTTSSAQGVFGDRRKEERLINDQKLDSMRQSLSALVAMEGTNNEPKAQPTQQTSLEDLTRDLMRPMLKEWLDENLPKLVEEMVAREIRRINGK